MQCLALTIPFVTCEMTLCAGTLQVDRFWGRALLWILFLVTIVLSWPNFDQGACRSRSLASGKAQLLQAISSPLL